LHLLLLDYFLVCAVLWFKEVLFVRHANQAVDTRELLYRNCLSILARSVMHHDLCVNFACDIEKRVKLHVCME